MRNYEYIRSHFGPSLISHYAVPCPRIRCFRARSPKCSSECLRASLFLALFHLSRWQPRVLRLVLRLALLRHRVEGSQPMVLHCRILVTAKKAPHISPAASTDRKQWVSNGRSGVWRWTGEHTRMRNTFPIMGGTTAPNFGPSGVEVTQPKVLQSIASRQVLQSIAWTWQCHLMRAGCILLS